MVMKRAFLPYKFIGNVIWFYSLFKVKKMDYHKSKHIEICTIKHKDGNDNNFWDVEMYVKNYVEKIDVPLKHIPDLVIICICLHN